MPTSPSPCPNSSLFLLPPLTHSLRPPCTPPPDPDPPALALLSAVDPDESTPAELDSSLPRPPERIVGRLRSHISWWASQTHDLELLSWIRDGYRLPLASDPTPRIAPNHRSALTAALFVTSAISDLLASGAVLPWTQHPTSHRQARPTVCSPLSVATRASGAQRLCIDLQHVNSFLSLTPFSYESLANLADILQPHDLIFNWDLKSGYHHIEIHPEHLHLLGFSWYAFALKNIPPRPPALAYPNRSHLPRALDHLSFLCRNGLDYYFAALPFGLASACQAFTRVTRALVSRWRSLGLPVLHYLGTQHTRSLASIHPLDHHLMYMHLIIT